MGQFDSSRTRVAPFFNALSTADPYGTSWLAPLLALPTSRSMLSRTISPPLRTTAWHPKEAALDAPRRLLHWLVDNIATQCAGKTPPPGFAGFKSSGPDDKRGALLAGDPSTIRLAHTLLDSGRRLPSRAWYVLETASRPDAMLTTDDAVIVIEGKRTEGAPTKSTEWLAGRHQMLRHLDAAWEIRGSRQLYGFFLVEGGGSDPSEVPPVWRRGAANTLISESLAIALPHRTDAERAEIGRCFLGAATWQAACADLGVSYAALPERVDPSRAP